MIRCLRSSNFQLYSREKQGFGRVCPVIGRKRNDSSAHLVARSLQTACQYPQEGSLHSSDSLYEAW